VGQGDSRVRQLHPHLRLSSPISRSRSAPPQKQFFLVEPLPCSHGVTIVAGGGLLLLLCGVNLTLCVLSASASANTRCKRGLHLALVDGLAILQYVCRCRRVRLTALTTASRSWPVATRTRSLSVRARGVKPTSALALTTSHLANASTSTRSVRVRIQPG